MRRTFVTLVTLLTLTFPACTVGAQSGDATWLESMDGLQTAIGRSWMGPVTEIEVTTTTEFNELGTPVSSETIRTATGTPELGTVPDVIMLSALVFEFDSHEHANEALQIMNADQMKQLERDPRAPEMNEFLTEKLGDMAFGHEGSYAVPDMEQELAVVYLMVQDGPYVYQIFGVFVSGDHIGIATGVAENMVAAEPGNEEPMYDMAGDSTGGNWEILNAIDLAMPEGTVVNDLDVYPVDPNSVIGDSQVVPAIDLEQISDTPGLTNSWFASYQSHEMTELVGTPTSAPNGVYSIELWVMEFTNPTAASAAVFAMDAALAEPLGVVSTEGSGFETSDGETGMTLVNTGFVRERSIPEGDAGTVVTVAGSTVYAARVYANGPAPTPMAQQLVQRMIDTPAGTDVEAIDGVTATGGIWEKFPTSGSDSVSGLDITVVRHDQPLETPVATPAQ